MKLITAALSALFICALCQNALPAQKAAPEAAPKKSDVKAEAKDPTATPARISVTEGVTVPDLARK